MKDITGQKFGNLTAIEPIGRNKFGRAVWRCICDWRENPCGDQEVEQVRRICHSCGLEFDGKVRDWYCPTCEPIVRREQKDRRNARRREERRKKAMMAERVITPVYETLGQRNKRMRELGLTYGGRPIVSQHVGWPKFLQEAVKKWRKNA